MEDAQAGSCLRVAILDEWVTMRERLAHPGGENIRIALCETCWAGCASPCPLRKHDARARVTKLKPAAIRQGKLSAAKFDVFVVAGGRATRQAERLGEEGMARIRDFVASGGGYVGVCAGAFLAAGGYQPQLSLRLLRADVVLPWKRGGSMVRLQLSALGRGALWDEGLCADAHSPPNPCGAHSSWSLTEPPQRALPGRSAAEEEDETEHGVVRVR